MNLSRQKIHLFITFSPPNRYQSCVRKNSTASVVIHFTLPICTIFIKRSNCLRTLSCKEVALLSQSYMPSSLLTCFCSHRVSNYVGATCELAWRHLLILIFWILIMFTLLIIFLNSNIELFLYSLTLLGFLFRSSFDRQTSEDSVSTREQAERYGNAVR